MLDTQAAKHPYGKHFQANVCEIGLHGFSGIPSDRTVGHGHDCRSAVKPCSCLVACSIVFAERILAAKSRDSRELRRGFEVFVHQIEGSKNPYRGTMRRTHLSQPCTPNLSILVPKQSRTPRGQRQGIYPKLELRLRHRNYDAPYWSTLDPSGVLRSPGKPFRRTPSCRWSFWVLPAWRFRGPSNYMYNWTLKYRPLFCIWFMIVLGLST